MKQTRVVVVGTGTEIGKTHASVALVSALAARGRSVTGLKPIESGVGPSPTDAGRLAAVSTVPPSSLHRYAFAEAVSPHLAARATGVVIDLDEVRAWVSGQLADTLLVETAGGLLSPLAPGLTNLDLLLAVRADAVVLVAPDRLGVLHDVSAAMLALRVSAPRSREPLVLLQPPPVSDTSTGTNRAELLGLGIASRVVSFPRCADPLEALAAADLALELLLPAP